MRTTRKKQKKHRIVHTGFKVSNQQLDVPTHDPSEAPPVVESLAPQWDGSDELSQGDDVQSDGLVDVQDPKLVSHDLSDGIPDSQDSDSPLPGVLGAEESPPSSGGPGHVPSVEADVP